MDKKTYNLAEQRVYIPVEFFYQEFFWGRLVDSFFELYSYYDGKGH